MRKKRVKAREMERERFSNCKTLASLVFLSFLSLFLVSSSLDLVNDPAAD